MNNFFSIVSLGILMNFMFFSETLRIKFDTKKTNGHIKRETSRSSTSFLQAINHWECRFKKANQRKQYLEFLWPWSLSTQHTDRPTDIWVVQSILSQVLRSFVSLFFNFSCYILMMLVVFVSVYFFSMVVKWFSARHFGGSFVCCATNKSLVTLNVWYVRRLHVHNWMPMKFLHFDFQLNIDNRLRIPYTLLDWTTMESSGFWVRVTKIIHFERSEQASFTKN